MYSLIPTPDRDSFLHALTEAIAWVRPVFAADGSIEDFEFGYANRAADANIAHSGGSITGLRVLRDRIPTEEAAEANFESYRDVYLSGTGKEFSFYTPNPEHYYETKRKWHEGGVLSITLNRREQRDAEKKEREQTMLLNGILQHTPAGLVAYESIRDASGAIRDFRVLLYNGVIHQLTGIPEEERKRLTFRELLRTLQSEETITAHIRTVETGMPINYEFFNRRIRRWLYVSVVRLGDGFLILINDITEQKKSREVLEEAESRLRRIVNSQLSIVTLLSPEYDESGEIADFRFLMANPHSYRYFPGGVTDVEGKRMSGIYPNYHASEAFRHHKNAYLSGQPVFFELQFSLDGKTVWFEVLANRIGDDLLISHHDLTGAKNLQLELERSVEELKRSNKDLEEVAFAASHDLQEPLRKILTFSGRLSQELAGQMNPEQQELFLRMEKATRRMRNLIEDLMAYSQVSIRPESMEPVHLNDIVRLALHEEETLVRESGCVVSTSGLPTITGDARQMTQLFRNLITNAIKYRSPHRTPRMFITCRTVSENEEAIREVTEVPAGRYYLIEVADNGIGFEKEYAEKIFHLFQRLHPQAEYTGTGIGLAIVQKVVANHRGYVSASGHPDVGAVFRIVLPA